MPLGANPMPALHHYQPETHGDQFSTRGAGGKLPYYGVLRCFLEQREGDALFVQSHR